MLLVTFEISINLSLKNNGKKQFFCSVFNDVKNFLK